MKNLLFTLATFTGTVVSFTAEEIKSIFSSIRTGKQLRINGVDFDITTVEPTSDGEAVSISVTGTEHREEVPFHVFRETLCALKFNHQLRVLHTDGNVYDISTLANENEPKEISDDTTEEPEVPQTPEKSEAQIEKEKRDADIEQKVMSKLHTAQSSPEEKSETKRKSGSKSASK